MRTTSLSPDDAVAAYTKALSDKGFQKLDAPQSLPLPGVTQGAYLGLQNHALLVEAMGPKTFEQKELQSAKSEIPPDTTVVWLIAVAI